MTPISVLDPPLPDASTLVEWRGLPGTCAALAVAAAASKHLHPVVVFCPSEQEAYRLEEELRFLLDPELPVVHLPDTEVLPYEAFSPHQEILSERLAALHRLPRMTRGVLVATADALVQRLPPRRWLDQRSLVLKLGDRLSSTEFRERLISAGYVSVSEVQTQGEFAVRGALLDLFPMGAEVAYRIDLFDDEIDAIRIFDPETQRSTEKVEAVRLLPARNFPTDREAIERFRSNYRAYFAGDPSRSRIYSQVSKGLMPGGIEGYLPLFFEETAGLVDYLPEGALCIELGNLAAALTADWKQIGERYERYSGDIERPLMKPPDLYFEPGSALGRLDAWSRARIDADGGDFGCGLMPGGADAVKRQLAEAPDRVLFIAESPGRREALLAWLRPQGITPREYRNWPDFLAADKRYGISIGPLHENVWLTEGIRIVAEAQVFGFTAPAARIPRRARVRDPETLLRDLNDLRIDAPVVHVQHGVGRYKGLEKITTGGLTAEYLVLEYDRGDKLYVPVGSLHLIHRYTGADSEQAPLHALGSDRWEKAQARARRRAHDVAAELLQIHARRAARPGTRMVPDPEDFQRFCAAFPFQTTPDQQKAIDDVLGDLAGERPMDRVVCGDVGFGKTEVALRASFAAVSSGRQVAVLVPTTLLAQQHHKNFADRYAGWPVRIAALSRMRTAGEQKTLLADLAEGRLDIVIGTHRLLQEDVRFKNLGLIIVDEEHRFGVRHKERLKNLRAEVDMLTLTATPIPRTLNMSLAGLRDLSLIATPPQGRVAIKTFVTERDRALLIEACQRELRRGGQVYYLHNEVRDIERVAREVQDMVPEARVRVAHGQMRERELEQVMLDFYHQRFNILVCTTIIESGIDVPTANTIIMDRADELGLAQLHQLRGRVGRSHHRAYAYLLVPSRRALKSDAARRLEAVEAMGELGSGFMLATHDLEIRGAGELLGAQQSGQIEEVGFTLYAQLLARAVSAIRSGKLDDRPFGETGCEVDVAVTALIPDNYVPDVDARLVLYKRIAEAARQDALEELKVEIIDRFGPLPEPLLRLFDAAGLRVQAEPLGIQRLRFTARGLTVDFETQPRIEPSALIRLIQSQPKTFRLEGQQRLVCQLPSTATEERIAAARDLLDTLSPRVGRNDS